MKINLFRPQSALGFLTALNHRPLRPLALCGVLLLGLSACRATTPPQWQWQRVEAGLPRQAIVLAVAADPIDPNQLWAGYYAPNGLATSRDGGQTWTLGGQGLGDNPIFDLLVALPIGDDKGRAKLWAATRDGLYQSIDSGTSWQPVGRGLPPITAFALASDGSGRVFVGFDGAGIYAEAHNGPGWEPLTSSSFSSASGSLVENEVLAPAAVLSLAVSPDGQRLYAGTPGSGIFASQDGGQTWLNTYAGEYAPNVAVDPVDPTRAVASLRDRLVRTYDGGQSWHTVPVAWASDEIVSLLWLADSTLGAGTGQGQLYRSLDGGDTWVEGGLGLSSAGGVMALAPAGGQSLGHPQRFLAGTWSGVYASDDGGKNWTKLAPLLGIPNAHTLLTAANGLLLGTRTGLFRWHAETQGWTPTATEFLPGGVASLANAPSDNQILYAGTTSNGVYRSNDLGTSWQRVPSLGVGVPALAVDPNNPDHAYMLAIWERVYETHDGGQHWAARWAGLGQVIEAVSLAIDPGDSTIYVGTETGLYRTQGNEPWQLVAPDLADQTILSLMAQPASSNRRPGDSILYIGATRGIYRSLDAGDTGPGLADDPDWGSGLKDVSVTALLADDQDPQVLYAGTAYAGVHQSTDGGQTWQPIGPMESSEGIIEAIAWGPDGALFVASSSGVWRGLKH